VFDPYVGRDSRKYMRDGDYALTERLYS